MDLEPVPSLNMARGSLRCFFLQGMPDSGRSILVIGFAGSYGFGSQGNPDAEFMNEAIESGVMKCEPTALILDLSQLEYVWGDMLESVLPGEGGEFGAPCEAAALVVGPGCREGIRTLIFGINAHEELDQLAWVHDSLASACTYIEGRLKAAQQGDAADKER
jgi:hypothetical protein